MEVTNSLTAMKDLQTNVNRWVIKFASFFRSNFSTVHWIPIQINYLRFWLISVLFVVVVQLVSLLCWTTQNVHWFVLCITHAIEHTIEQQKSWTSAKKEIGEKLRTWIERIKYFIFNKIVCVLVWRERFFHFTD